MDNTTNRISIWLAWFTVSVFYAYQYILRILPNVLMPEIMKRFHIDADIFEQFTDIYYIAYIGMHLPIGTWLDRKGPKYVIPSCIFISVAGVLPLLYSDSWVMAYIAIALIGFGSCGAILGLFKVVHLGFPENKFSRMLGIGVAIGLLGASYGSQPVSELFAIYGYERVIRYIIYIGLALAVVSYFTMPQARGVRNDEIDFKKDFSALWKKKKIFLIGIFAGLMIGPLEGFADAWGTSFLETVYAFNKDQATFLSSLIFLGMCVGASIISYIANKTRCYYSVIILSAFFMAGAFLLILFTKVNMNLLILLLFVIGLFCAYQVLAVYKSITYVKEGLVGLATATVNMIFMSFGYFFHSIIGRILQATGGGKIVDGVPIYSANSFIYGVSVIPIALILGAFGFLWMRKK
jgi:predicted MFS family arabinose efflux permease